MAIKWSSEMLEELKNVVDLGEFAKKHGMARATAKNKRAILCVEKVVEEVKKEENIDLVASHEPNLAEQLGEVNASTIEIIPSVILNIDSLIEKGTKFYLVEVQKEISTLDKSISDILHVLENQYDELDDCDMLKLTKNVGKLRRKRRLFKNEYSFLDNQRVDCEAFIKFIKEVRSYSLRVCDKKYTTRVLKEELGKVQICNSNNSELITLRERVAELESQKEKVPVGTEIEDEFLSLVKYKIKSKRKEDREKKIVVPIDKLYPQWREMFNSMDEETKVGILADAESSYNKCSRENVMGSKKVKEHVIWNDVLPRILYNKGYFIIKR